jgi:hypothetical protein
MKRVPGIGGIFFKTKDRRQTKTMVFYPSWNCNRSVRRQFQLAKTRRQKGLHYPKYF